MSKISRPYAIASLEGMPLVTVNKEDKLEIERSNTREYLQSRAIGELARLLASNVRKTLPTDMKGP